MTSTSEIICSVSKGVLTLRINRPDKKNAVTKAMYSAMAEAIAAADADRAVRALLIVGSHGVFCAGNDMEDFRAPQELDLAKNPTLRFMFSLANFGKPVVAGVAGPAVGIGSTLLLHCDLVYAAEKSRFVFPFVNLGICPEYASTLLLPAIMGHRRAAEMMMLAEPIDAAKAREYGIVNAILPDDEVERAALERAEKLAAMPPNALRVTKQLMKRWSQPQVSEAIRLEAEHFLPMKQEEASEAVNAFLEKRKPDFSRFA